MLTQKCCFAKFKAKNLLINPKISFSNGKSSLKGVELKLLKTYEIQINTKHVRYFSKIQATKNETESNEKIYSQTGEVDENNIESQFQLGMKYFQSNDFTNALKYFKTCSDQGDLESTYMYGKCLLQSDLQSQKQALSIFEKCSSLGHSDADLQLSTMYENGVGCTKDLQKSSFYAKSSADKGNSNGAYAYAEHLWYGIGVPINEKLAVSYYKLASDLGFQEAHYKLWQIYHYGLGGIPIDETLALHYCKLGADSGHKQSLFNYGLSLAIGTEKVKKDIKESFKYFKECSEKFDDVQSTVNCAFILENEIKNIEEAAKYYKKAADLNSIDCCKYYSQMLELGKGVSKDLIESIFYYEKYTDLKRIETLMKANENWFYILKKEAEKGNSESAYILSKCYKYGYPDFILIEDNMNEKELELLKIAGNNISKKKSNERKKIKSHNLLTIASIGVLLFGVFSLRGFTK